MAWWSSQAALCRRLKGCSNVSRWQCSNVSKAGVQNSFRCLAAENLCLAKNRKECVKSCKNHVKLRKNHVKSRKLCKSAWQQCYHPYLIFVILFTQAKILNRKFYTKECVNYGKRISRQNSVNCDLWAQANYKYQDHEMKGRLGFSSLSFLVTEESALLAQPMKCHISNVS